MKITVNVVGVLVCICNNFLFIFLGDLYVYRQKMMKKGQNLAKNDKKSKNWHFKAKKSELPVDFFP